MDDLVADRFVVLGGPVGDDGPVLLLVEAADVDAIERRLAADPWPPSQLMTGSIQPWSLWLDGRTA